MSKAAGAEPSESQTQTEEPGNSAKSKTKVSASQVADGSDAIYEALDVIPMDEEETKKSAFTESSEAFESSKPQFGELQSEATEIASPWHQSPEPSLAETAEPSTSTEEASVQDSLGLPELPDLFEQKTVFGEERQTTVVMNGWADNVEQTRKSTSWFGIVVFAALILGLSGAAIQYRQQIFDVLLTSSSETVATADEQFEVLLTQAHQMLIKLSGQNKQSGPAYRKKIKKSITLFERALALEEGLTDPSLKHLCQAKRELGVAHTLIKQPKAAAAAYETYLQSCSAMPEAPEVKQALKTYEKSVKER